MKFGGAAACGAVILAAVQSASPALAQEAQAPNAPPSWDTLVRCADMPDAGKELDCYREAMRAAGYHRNPERAAAEQRKSFGLSLPAIHLGKQERKGGEEAARQEGGAIDENRVEVTISTVAYTRPLNQILFVTTEGAVWVQDDTVAVNFEPKPGDMVKISKTTFGGYFCDFGHSNAVRCVRRN